MRLQAFLRAVAAPDREVVVEPPFTAYFHSGDSLRFLNYAIPDDAAQPDEASIDRLREAFRARGRLLRLEWIEEAAPAVAARLAGAGVTEELRAPLMSCAPRDLLDPRTDLADLDVALVRDGGLRDCANLQREAFGQAPLADDAEPRDPRSSGGGAVLARVGGDPVAAASWTPIVDGVTEIVGVATAESWRRHGLAGAVTAAAARAAYEAGATLCILSPGNETAQGVYARAGFRRAATMLHWSDPD